MNYIDRFLNSVTMYRLTMYYLVLLVAASCVFSITGVISYSIVNILLSTSLALFVGLVTNTFFAKFFHAVTNVESVFVTALILVLLIPPVFPKNVGFVMLAVFFAMASKYLVTVDKKHIFNPAGIALVATILVMPDYAAIWWVGITQLMPLVLLGGLLLMRKVRKEAMVSVFLLTYFSLITVVTFLTKQTLPAVLHVWDVSVFHSALFFFTFAMFTEPLTSPTRKKWQLWYAGLVAFLYATPQLRLFSLGLSPEIALSIGNIFAYVVSPKYRLVLALQQMKRVGDHIVFFFFQKPSDFSFTPGQYMEWTLPHAQTDARGNRRYFSIASSPTEEMISLMVRMNTPSSSYKQALLSLAVGQPIVAAQLAGDFVLPTNRTLPLVFIAGGVGFAPFRSMIAYLVDKKETRDITLLYANKTTDDIFDQALLEKAKEVGVKTVYYLTEQKMMDIPFTSHTGHMTKETIVQDVPLYQTALFYISGPQLMVQSMQVLLLSMGISVKNIKVDFFPGYEENA